MRPFYLPFLLAFLFNLSQSYVSAQNCSITGSAIYGTQNSNQRGYSMAATLEGDAFYVAGLKEDSVQLLKIDLAGHVIWTRTFDVVPGKIDHVDCIIVDSEGMIAMSGLSGNINTGDLLFGMRYDPVTDNVLWAKTYMSTDAIYLGPIIQKGSGGNYMMTSNPHKSGGDDCEILELDKNTGDVVLTFAKHYHLGASETLFSMIYDSAHVYGVGRFTDGDDNQDMRHTVIKLNATNGIPIWTKLGYVSAQAVARLYGFDIVLHEDDLYSGFFGDPTGTTLSNTKLYLQKTDTDGNLIWIKQYELPGANDVGIKIIKSGNGLVILAGKRAFPSEFILYKVDFEGDILWSKLFQFPGALTSLGNTHAKSNQLIQVGDKLVFTGYGTNPSGGTNMIVVITNLEGETDMPCVNDMPLDIQVTTINNGVFYNVNPTVISVDPPVEDHFPESIVTQAQLIEECVFNDTLFEEISIVICEGEMFEGYSTSGLYIDTFTTISDCDSIRALHLTVIPSVVLTLRKSICHDESFEGYSISGTYADTFALANGCDSIRILELTSLACASVIHYDLNACTAYMHNGSNMDYSEFVPSYPEFTCGEVSADILHRTEAQENKHSCTPGINNSVAMCVSSYQSCTYDAGNSLSVIIEFTVDPIEDSLFTLSKLEFYEKAPLQYVWIDGPSGLNNYPQRYGIRILKNGIEIFRNTSIPTNLNWTLQSFDFIDNELFKIESVTDFRIELLPYCPIGNGANVSAWDLDEISIYAACAAIENDVILGQVTTIDERAVNEVEIRMAENSGFQEFISQRTYGLGNYIFSGIEHPVNYLMGFKNDDILNGISTIDLLYIQKHLLGITTFTSLAEYIAADINNNDVVTASDILELRKIILGINDEFPLNKSWKFGPIDQDMQGMDLSTFKEVHEIQMVKDTLIGNFLGVKIGDLNRDVILQASSTQIESRSNEVFVLSIDEQRIHKNTIVSIEVKAGTPVSIVGLQFALNLWNIEILSIESGSINLDAGNYFIDENILKVSWNDSKEVSLSGDDVLFTIVAKANKGTSVMEAIKLNMNSLHPELYTPDLKVLEMALQVKQVEMTSFVEEYLSIDPNPIIHEANIRFHLKEAGIASICFYDISGRLVYKIKKPYQAGYQEEQVNRRQLSSMNGIYYCQLVTGSTTIVQKFMLGE